MNKKLSPLIYLFFILIYANQGFSSLPEQCYYYLFRETWHMSATMITFAGFLTGLAWCVKPLFGIAIDCFPIKQYRTKYYLIINCYIMIALSVYIMIFGLANIFVYIFLAMLYNFALSFNDVANDSQMVVLEQKYNLKGKIQAIQWISLGTAGLLVSVLGALIASKVSEPLNYKLAVALITILPIIILVYISKYYTEQKTFISNNINKIKLNFKYLKNKYFLVGLIFILCLQFSPSIGIALMIKMREGLGIDKMFIGYLSATGTVLGLLGYIIYYWKCWKISMKKLLYFTVAFSGLTNLFYLWIPNKWIILSYNVIFGALGGICFLTLLAYMAQIVPVGAEGLFYALVTSVNNLAARLGSIVGGIIYDNFGYNINVVVASVTTLLCLFFIPYLKTEN